MTVFVPKWRSTVTIHENTGASITDQQILHKLYQEHTLTYTPSRGVGKKTEPMTIGMYRLSDIRLWSIAMGG